MRTILHLARAYGDGTLSPMEYLEARLQALDFWQERTHLFVSVDRQAARREAEESERRYRSRVTRGPLDGILVGLKDLIDLAFVPTTAGSEVRKHHVASQDADVTQTLRHNGANMALGKLNLHEFAYGPTSVHSHFGPVVNPYQPGYMAGGSSGGSAVGVAVGLFSATLGTDTGGSIRIPAALSGVSGYKPTYGRLSRRGIVPLSWSLDHVGPLARSVEDLAMMWRVLSGETPSFPPSRRLRVYWPSGDEVRCYDESLDNYISGAVDNILVSVDAEVTRGPLMELESIWSAQSIIIASEALSYHWESLQHARDQYQADVRERLERARSYSALEYIQALRYRQQIAKAYDHWMQSYDLIIMPTVPILAPRLDTLNVSTPAGELQDVRAALTRFTSPFNFLGLPALSMPWGLLHGLPVGLQCIAPRGRDQALLALCQRIQEAHPQSLTVPDGAMV